MNIKEVFKNFINKFKKNESLVETVDEELYEDYEEEFDEDSIEYETYHEIVEEEPPPIISQAKNLPEGWTWKDYWDGSGSLKSPEKKSYFSYDLVEYER